VHEGVDRDALVDAGRLDLVDELPVQELELRHAGDGACHRVLADRLQLRCQSVVQCDGGVLTLHE
jgi:hypothetical protein